MAASRVAFVAWAWRFAPYRFPPPQRRLLLHSNAAQASAQAQMQRYDTGTAAGMVWCGMRNPSKSRCQPYQAAAPMLRQPEPECAQAIAVLRREA
jgi:hypothetical protein